MTAPKNGFLRAPWVSGHTGYTFRVFTRAGRRSIWQNAMRAWTLAAKLRTLWHVFYDGELCDRCGRRYDAWLWWCPDGRLYAKLTGLEPVEPYPGGLFCPRCFDELAEEHGLLLQWQPYVLMDRATGEMFHSKDGSVGAR